MSKKPKTSCCNILLTVLISPIGLIFNENIPDKQIAINLIFFIFGLGQIHAFYVKGLSCLESTLCAFLPFVGVFLVTGKCRKFCFCLFLCFFFFLPGVIYAYYESVLFVEEKNDEGLDLELNLGI